MSGVEGSLRLLPARHLVSARGNDVTDRLFDNRLTRMSTGTETGPSECLTTPLHSSNWLSSVPIMTHYWWNSATTTGWLHRLGIQLLYKIARYNCPPFSRYCVGQYVKIICHYMRQSGRDLILVLVNLDKSGYDKSYRPLIMPPRLY